MFREHQQRLHRGQVALEGASMSYGPDGADICRAPPIMLIGF